MKSDIDISRSSLPQPISRIASKLGINKKYLFYYGDYIAKVSLEILNKINNRPKSKYILVTAITPTALGEGKTVTTIGLSMALNKLKKKTACCIRQPSLGPVFGIKGSAGGGGYSQVLPRDDFDLHFTGDAHAVGLAHNICAAFLDNSIFRGNKFNIDLNKIYWKRVVDIGDRSLRYVRIGLGSIKDGVRRESGFEITASSEIMAILALARDFNDLKKRLSNIVVAQDKAGNCVSASDLKVSGLMSVLLKDAVKPNLIQTIENTPCFVHTGPFANIAHGNSSIIQDKIALSLCDYVVTEAGFGADCGAEKFFDIKCRASGLTPDAVVLVCSVRALKAHGESCGMERNNILALEKGLSNLKKQIENIKSFGVPVVVAINRFETDKQEEINIIRRDALIFGADDCQISEVWAKGSSGGLDLARSVVKLSHLKNKFRYLYPLDAPVKDKIKAIATRIYGAKDVSYSKTAKLKLRGLSKAPWNRLPVCMAKTQFSLSHNPELKGAPQGFILPVRDLRVFAGAGFISCLCGDIQTMPGLPRSPRGENIDIDSRGNTIGLI